MTTSTTPTIVLVHGGFADASGFAGVIRELQSAGHTVVAAPNPLRSLACDAAALAATVSAIDSPVVLVGHSYGGAVITQASAGLANVTALVYLAAFGLDEGESCASVQQPFSPPLLASTSYPTGYDAPGAPRGPTSTSRRSVSARPSVQTYQSMSPRSCSPLSGRSPWPRSPKTPPPPAGRPSRRGIFVSEHDNAIAPDASGSGPNAWAPPPSPSRILTPLSSLNR